MLKNTIFKAKSIELDEKIPFISKLKRYSNLTNKTEEFSKAETAFIKTIEWNMQCVTLIDLLEFYLAQGIVYQSDEFDQSCTDDTALKEKKLNFDDNYQKLQQDQLISNLSGLNINEKENSEKSKITVKQLPESKIFQAVCKIEKEYMRLSNLIIRDNSFYQFDLKVLAASSIAFLRKVTGLSPSWCNNLEQMTGIKESEIQECFSILENKFEGFFTPIKRTSSIFANLNNQSTYLDENFKVKPMTPTKSQLYQGSNLGLSTNTNNMSNLAGLGLNINGNNNLNGISNSMQKNWKNQLSEIPSSASTASQVLGTNNMSSNSNSMISSGLPTSLSNANLNSNNTSSQTNLSDKKDVYSIGNKPQENSKAIPSSALSSVNGGDLFQFTNFPHNMNVNYSHAHNISSISYVRHSSSIGLVPYPGMIRIGSNNKYQINFQKF